MSSATQVLKSVGPKLVPFFKSVCVYFVLLTEQPCLSTVCFKCLPILSLIIFIFLHGISLSKEHTFSRKILIGLIFSCFGDACLVWPNGFIPGMVMFALAQTMYITAFGFSPINLKLGAVIYVICGIISRILLPGLDGILVFGVPIYIMFIGTMAWRALSRINFFGDEPWMWPRLCSGIGSISFVVSDTLLGFHHFYCPIPYATVLIMVTYYAAQLGIALSAIESKTPT